MFGTRLFQTCSKKLELQSATILNDLHIIFCSPSYASKHQSHKTTPWTFSSSRNQRDQPREFPSGNKRQSKRLPVSPGWDQL